MTFLAAELNTGKCRSFHEPSLSGMLYQRRLRRPSRWTFSIPGSPLSSNSTNPSPTPTPSPHPKSPLSKPTTPTSSSPILDKNGKWKFWAWHDTHYCITTEPSKEWCWLYKLKKKKKSTGDRHFTEKSNLPTLTTCVTPYSNSQLLTLDLTASLEQLTKAGFVCKAHMYVCASVWFWV